MDIPVLTRFVKGLKLFFESKRLRWFFLIFIISAFFTLVFRELGNFFPQISGAVILFIGGIFPTFFLLTAFLSLLGLQRFVASEESYGRSFVFFIVWVIVSVVVYAILWVTGLVFVIMIGIAFLGWIGFQAYLSSRSALGYAEKVQITTRSKAVTFIFGSLHIVSYVIVIGSFAVFALWNYTSGGGLDGPTFLAAILGAVLALGFNFLNGVIMIRERKRATVDNLALLGLFVSLYSAYFLYNILKPVSASFDLVSLLIDMGTSVFFLLYAMSSVGLTLSSRAHLETRWKISGELAATLTFFLASGYLVVQALFGTLAAMSGGMLGERIPDVIKLFVFPFVALVMELLFIRKSRKAEGPKPVPDYTADEVEEELVTDETEESDVEPEDSMPAEEPEVNEEPEVVEEPEEDETSVTEDDESYDDESEDDTDSWDE